MKSMSLKEFVELGLLQEINRRFLHPTGVALSAEYPTVGTQEQQDTPTGFGGILDARDDPEGFCFEAGLPEFTRAKEERVTKMLESKREARERHLGYFIQPTPDPEVE